MNDIQLALGIDLITLTTCTILLFRFGRISAMHPATLYLFFHIWVVTKRLVELNLGAPLFAAFPNQPITLTELTRGALMFDLVLAVMTTAWLIISAADFKRNGPLPAPGHEKAPNLSKHYMVGFAVLMIPLTLFSLLKGGGGAAQGAEGVASDITGTFTNWIPLWLMPLFYWYGPRKWVVAAIVAMDALCEHLMGDTRWLLLLPTIFFCFAYLSRTGRKWPSRQVAIILAVAGVLWLPGKQISHILQGGGSLAQAAQAVPEVWESSATKADHPDTDFLDMAAMTVSLVDEKGQFYYGNTFWPALYNFIPRAIWPDKPQVAQWEKDVSTKNRPMATYGMTASLMGASYVDFGYYGVVIIPFLFAFFSRLGLLSGIPLYPLLGWALQLPGHGLYSFSALPRWPVHVFHLQLSLHDADVYDCSPAPLFSDPASRTTKIPQVGASQPSECRRSSQNAAHPCVAVPIN